MTNYRRLISYIYAYEGEIKGKNIGFAKLESRNGQCKLSVNVKKVYVGSSDLEVYLLAPGKEIPLGSIFIRSGAGEFRTAISVENAADSGCSMDRCYGLSIHEKNDSWRSYTTIWEDAVAQAAELELADVTSENRGDSQEQLHKKVENLNREIDRAVEAEEKTVEELCENGISGESKPIEESKIEEKIEGLYVNKHENEGQISQAEEGSPAGEPGLEEKRSPIGRLNPIEERFRANGGNTRQRAFLMNQPPAGTPMKPMKQLAADLDARFGASFMQPLTHANTTCKMVLTPDKPVQPDSTSKQEGSADGLEKPFATVFGTAPATYSQPVSTGIFSKAPVSAPAPAAASAKPPVSAPAPAAASAKPPVPAPAPAAALAKPPVPAPAPASASAKPPVSAPASAMAPANPQLQMPVASEPSANTLSPESAAEPVPESASEKQPRPITIDAPKEEEIILGDPQILERLEEEERMNTKPQELWEHFRKKYPKIQAFDSAGGCEILTIKPQDIGLLPRETWNYGNNSFLLHGYYNYRYLILARVGDGTQSRVRYILGVPGHYYSNEKYMASMFGFPHFVLSKKQPSQDGRFGYWYTDIRLENQD